MTVAVIGGGWAGCAAALMARKRGVRTILFERSDMLLGTGLVGGIMRNNGRYTAAEEMAALGGGELFTICDDNARHVNVSFPGHEHATLYDTAKVQGGVTRCLKEHGVEISFQRRVVKVHMRRGSITGVEDETGQTCHADAFVDATGTAGPLCNCTLYGNGCAMCTLRCPSFGGRVSVAALAGVKEKVRMREDGGVGAMSGSCEVDRASIADSIEEELRRRGTLIVPVPEHLRQTQSPLRFTDTKMLSRKDLATLLYCRMRDITSPGEIPKVLKGLYGEIRRKLGRKVPGSSVAPLSFKVCQQYATSAFTDNLILLDTGQVKCMVPYYALEALRQIPGFENARYASPFAGGTGNAMRFFALSPKDTTLKVAGVCNLVCCGEKAGLLGHTEAIVTGTLAGFNAVMMAERRGLLELPAQLAAGDIIAAVNDELTREGALTKTFTFSGSVYFERMKAQGLYTTDRAAIRRRVEATGLAGIFN